jgi:hypothetical protein
MTQQNVINNKNERIYPKRPVCPFRAHLSIDATFDQLTMVETFFASVQIIEGQSIIEKMSTGEYDFFFFLQRCLKDMGKTMLHFLGFIRHNEPRASLR